jgi:antitoxin (DNA-binding transcriptional repressor) of toxin-antitoxin stability system
MLKTITATEANRRFAEILRLIDEGETFIVTTHGRPRIRMERVREDVLEREAAKERLLERLRSQEGFEIRPWHRDELYEDEEVLKRENLEFLNYLRTLPHRTIGPWTRDELYDDNLELGE